MYTLLTHFLGPKINILNDSLIIEKINYFMIYVHKTEYDIYKKIIINKYCDNPYKYNNVMASILNLPITHLTILECYLHKKCNTDINMFDNLPKTLLYLNICYFDIIIINLPLNLKYFKFKSYQFNNSIDNLPSNLIYLSLRYNFNKLIDNLPVSLLYLHLYGKFNQHCDYLPNNLKYLDLEFTNFNYSVTNLPVSLIIIKLPRYCINIDIKLIHFVNNAVNLNLYLKIKHNPKLKFYLVKEFYGNYLKNYDDHNTHSRFNHDNLDFYVINKVCNAEEKMFISNI